MNTISRDSIDAISGGYRAAQILFTANRVGVFQALGKDARSLESLIGQTNANPRGLRVLCDALVSLGLLEKENNQYRNGTLAREYLLPGEPKSQNAMLLHGAKLYEKWGKLYDSVMTGEPNHDETLDERLRGDERSFAQAMADIGRLSAVQLAEMLDLSSNRNMLDIGGGPGLYSIEFVRRNSNLHATLFDNPKTLEVARANAEQAGVGDRISYHPGDALQDEFGEGYDFILISNVAHIFSFEENHSVVQRCARALVPGGRLCIKDFFVDADRTAPLWSVLFAVNMLVGTEKGGCYSVEEVQQWMKDAGLQEDGVFPIAYNSQLVLGQKR